jgi:membrane-anchored mycosin MYCP
MQRTVLVNGNARFNSDELVVRLPYHRLVLARLEQWNAKPTYFELEDKIASIGLCRIGLDSAAATAFLRDRQPTWVRRARRAAKGDGYVPYDLEIVLRCLRQSFAAEYGGWSPTLGKNRVMERLRGSYVIDGGGNGPDPVPQYVIDGGGSSGARPLGSPRSVAFRSRLPGAGTRVGVVDTKIWPHPWLSGAFVAYPEDILPMTAPADPGRPESSPHHATFVAGLILRQAPGAVVELRSALSADATSDTWTVARTISELAESSIELVNLSLGCKTEDKQPPLVMSAAIDALSPRTVVVAAAGNHGTAERSAMAEPSYPAALDVIAVGAMKGRQPAAFSPTAAWVDAMAPGVDVVSTCDAQHDGSALFGSWSGTSFAAAVVSGAIAAKVKEAGSAVEAWKSIQKTAPEDREGRPVVALSGIADWPPDGQ